jgi:hypothetical protein
LQLVFKYIEIIFHEITRRTYVSVYRVI